MNLSNGLSLGTLIWGLTLSLTVPMSHAEVASLSCLLEPSERISVSSQSPGVVDRIEVKRGQAVKQGDTLLVLKQTVEQAELNTAKARYEFAKRKQNRNRELRRQGLLSPLEVDELDTERQLGALAVKEAEARLLQKTILSPIDGVVLSRDASVGEFVSDEPVMTLVGLNPLHAEAVFREDHYGKIQVGAPVDLRVMGPVEEYIQAKVMLIDPVIDAASSTFGVRLSLPNPEQRIPAGLKCKLRLSEGKSVAAPALPLDPSEFTGVSPGLQQGVNNEKL
ncbi:MAG: efflux RND transporter periplasmic adaptor subunit [Oceanobacter sp.]